MSASVLVGTQWGDEGKGKVTDLISGDFDVVCRYAGGANAGHTVIVGDTHLALHQVPSGVIYEGTTPIIVFGGLAGLWFLVRFLARRPTGKLVIDKIKLRLPGFGQLIRKTAIGRTTRTLGTLMQSGVPVLQALDIVRDTAGNAVIANAYQRIHDAVKEGDNMTPSMEASGQFPPMVVSMVDVGEETGALPDMLNRIANTYDGEVDDAVSAMTSIIEPLMIVLLAVIVGTIVIAMFSPLTQIIGGMSAT